VPSRIVPRSCDSSTSSVPGAGGGERGGGGGPAVENLGQPAALHGSVVGHGRPSGRRRGPRGAAVVPAAAAAPPLPAEKMPRRDAAAPLMFACRLAKKASSAASCFARRASAPSSASALTPAASSAAASSSSSGRGGAKKLLTAGSVSCTTSATMPGFGGNGTARPRFEPLGAACAKRMLDERPRSVTPTATTAYSTSVGVPPARRVRVDVAPRAAAAAAPSAGGFEGVVAKE
jgi:hypothetical protein